MESYKKALEKYYLDYYLKSMYLKKWYILKQFYLVVFISFKCLAKTSGLMNPVNDFSGR